jgi:hypothetical protein
MAGKIMKFETTANFRISTLVSDKVRKPLVAKPQKNIDYDAIGKDTIRRFPKTLANLAK